MTGRIIVVGDIVTDVLAVYSGQLAAGSDTPAQVSLTAGGSAANTAAWLAASGTPVTLVGVVGDDAAGTDRLAELAAAGVDCAVRQVADAPTGTVVVLSHTGERTMLCDRGANARLSTGDLDRALAGAPDAVHLHLSGYALFDGDSRPAGRHALATARRAGLTTSVDAASAGPLRRVGGPAFLDWVRDADLLLANLDEAVALVGSADPVALSRHARHAIVKRGADGAGWASAGTEPVEVPAQPATVVDVTGAGDAFAAGLLTAWLGGAAPADALAAGARLGAEAVATAGARPPGPPGLWAGRSSGPEMQG
ncbi:carbohydrate kinase family protein [Rugosimonospora africana]|uniref:Ribokinase n=1 Tax=Rugosimonospora africana TaxID=556532 RepID=A0A8J3QPD9_9ACTN|nr:PfkB family carbohydrate kinase [Rugosimonospora africana]GIH13772.1 ribokinase [Rugosimonospora africana]